MWRWIKPWRDWAMHDLWSMHRTGPQPQAMHFSYEKAGLTVADQPIPWNAEAVVVEALLRPGPPTSRRKGDFQLRIDKHECIPAESLRKDETEEHYRLFFRLPVPAQPTCVEVIWRHTTLGQLTLPVLSRDEFLSHLRLQLPTLFVRLGDQSIACQTFVATQCRGLLASALLTSPTSLVPLMDLGLHVEFRSERTGLVHEAPARLCSSQLAGRQALLTVIPGKFPRRIGTWKATWLLGDRSLASHQVRAISSRHFLKSLRISDTRFIVQDSKTGLTQTRHAPAPDAMARIGPCFLISSAEPGMAGLCRLQVRAQVAGATQPPPLLEEEILITDGPSVFAPGTLDVANLTQVSGFELRMKGKTLGVLSLCPAPTASFTAEGGFRPAQDFNWSPAAEEELTDRLSRLIDGRANGSSL